MTPVTYPKEAHIDGILHTSVLNLHLAAEEANTYTVLLVPWGTYFLESEVTSTFLLQEGSLSLPLSMARDLIRSLKTQVKSKLRRKGRAEEC